MPSGMTSDIYEGKDVSLRDYLMTVGRQMGYAIMQRDDDPKEPVKPTEARTSYYDDQIVKEEARIAELHSMTPEAAEKAAARDYEERHNEWVASREKKDALRARYEEMIEQVEAWQPDPLIASTKDYALKYLRESIDFDCGKPEDRERFYPEPQPIAGPEWRAAQIEEAARSWGYSQKHRQEDEEREAERNRYIAAFLRSLPPASVPSGQSEAS